MHLNTELTLDLVEGRLDQKQQSFWKEHIAICDDCAQTVQRWQQFKIEQIDRLGGGRGHHFHLLESDRK